MAATVPQAGDRLGGRFRLVRPIGRGGMAAVWLAEDEQLERPVAIKLLADVFASDPDYAARFVREARIQGQLDIQLCINMNPSTQAAVLGDIVEVCGFHRTHQGLERAGSRGSFQNVQPGIVFSPG